MQVTNTAICFTVDDVAGSAAFLARHFGYQEAMSADGFVSLTRNDTAGVIFLRRGLEVLPADFRDQRAAGTILALTVADLDAEYARLQSEGAPITLPLLAEEWGERLFQVTDPNGVVIELLDRAGAVQ
ncbi:MULTISPECIES: VOC family protein [Kitasatospora]|uniref:VOC family protein n=1 Tax=Kitasatospora TaxID=2063 RepID=UPI000C701D7B|nr:VOC family protein [Kitasatospora sp. GP30]MDH6144928.1 catechol 2,3-dioxygenase-like lactoylglutathione lyase family enzyme [Kitasatospora sp. GP30]